MNIVNRRHPTLFMIDYRSAEGKEGTLKSFVSNEPNYDLAFGRAWRELMTEKPSTFQSPSKMLELLDKIQNLALCHIPDAKGRACTKPQEFNCFGISQNLISDEKGVADLIERVWKMSEPFEIMVKKDDEANTRYVLTTTKLLRVRGKQKVVLLCKDAGDNFSKISKKFLSLYAKGTCKNGSDRLFIIHKTGAEEREGQALQILGHYLKEIALVSQDSDKINLIALTVRNLAQLHLYEDGNGRVLYMFANFLMHRNGLDFFYPINLCIFEGNSIEKIVREILNGQKRYSEFFGRDLTEEMNKYCDVVFELMHFIEDNLTDIEDLKNIVIERNFNLLFRNAASNPKKIGLLKFLLNNKDILNIDIYARGDKSGNALDVAKKFNNEQAMQLLEFMS